MSGAMPALIAGQHYEQEEDTTPNLRWALEYLRAALLHIPNKPIPLLPRSEPPVVIYTDASDEVRGARVGGIVYVPGHRPAVFVYDVTHRTRALLGPQDKVINQAELLAAPLLVYTTPERLRGQDILWFLDNASAESALVKAGSPTCSMCYLALLASAALAGLDTRAWYEHVPSGDNPAYVLSREGYENVEVAAKVASGEWVSLVVVEPLATRSASKNFCVRPVV